LNLTAERALPSIHALNWTDPGHGFWVGIVFPREKFDIGHAREALNRTAIDNLCMLLPSTEELYRWDDCEAGPHLGVRYVFVLGVAGSA
jgi:hypothetical protein